MELLKDKEIQTKPYLPAIHLQPFYRKQGYTPGTFPICEAVANSLLALPFYTSIKKEEVKTVTDTLKEILHKVQ